MKFILFLILFFSGFANAGSPIIWSGACASGAYNLAAQSCLSSSASPTFTGLTTVNNLLIQGYEALAIYIDSTTTGANQTINAAGISFYELTGAAGGSSIDFITGGVTGQKLTIKNSTGVSLGIVYNTTINGGIITQTADTIVVPNGDTISFYNDPVHGFWYQTGANFIDASLPDQTGNAGSVFTTNGSASSWTTSIPSLTLTTLLNIPVQGLGVTPTGAIAGSTVYTSTWLLCVYTGAAWVQAATGATTCTF